jgi:hypothetical protein
VPRHDPWSRFGRPRIESGRPFDRDFEMNAANEIADGFV